LRSPYRALIAFSPRLWSNWLTLLGTVVVTTSAVTILVALVIDQTSTGLNTYAAAVVFLVVPALLVLGLLLIPLGLFFERHRRRVGRPPREADSVLAAFVQAMESEVVRKRVAFVLLLTVLNVLIFTTVTYRALAFMDTPQFCGTTCHSVMQPEYDAYRHSAHSRVACVQCHIGDGAQAWDGFQSRRPDVVISDWLMPGLTGLELCRNVRAHTGSYTYFIMVTGQGGLEQVLEGMSAGADDYLVKPLDVEDLQARLIAAARVTSLHHQLADQRTELERLNRRLADTNEDLRAIDQLTDEFGRARLTRVAAQSSEH